MKKVSQTLDTLTPSKNSREEAIKQAKAQLIELFINENTNFNTDADVNQAFDYFLKVIQIKQNDSKSYDPELSRKWEEIADELSDMHKAYNNPNNETNSDHMKKAMAQLHHRIQTITETQQNTTTPSGVITQEEALKIPSNNSTQKTSVKTIDTAEIITSLEKLIKETEKEIKNPAKNEYFKQHAKQLVGKNIWIDGKPYTVSHLNKNGTLEIKHKDQPAKISLSSFAELKKLGQVNGFADTNYKKASKGK